MLSTPIASSKIRHPGGLGPSRTSKAALLSISLAASLLVSCSSTPEPVNRPHPSPQGRASNRAPDPWPGYASAEGLVRQRDWPVRCLADGTELGGEANFQPPEPLEPLALPTYPAWAIVARIQGVIIAEAVVDASGAVTSARVTHPLPWDSSEVAGILRQARFRPAHLDGKPVAAIYEYRIEFRLR